MGQSSRCLRLSRQHALQHATATDDAIRALEIDGENRHALWLLPYLKAQDADMVLTKLKVKQAANPAKWDPIIADL